MGTKKEKSKNPDSRRTRARHSDSDSGSSGYRPSTTYRSLRAEERPEKDGLRPPAVHDTSTSVRAHVASGSRAKTKSAYVSTTGSKRSAAAWAATGEGGRGRVATVTTNSRTLDLSTPSGTKTHMGSDKTSAANSAMASKEAVTKHGFSSKSISRVQDVQSVNPRTARDIRTTLKSGRPATHDGRPVSHAQVSRAQATKSKVKTKPHGTVTYSDTSRFGTHSSKRDRSPSTSSVDSTSRRQRKPKTLKP